MYRKEAVQYLLRKVVYPSNQCTRRTGTMPVSGSSMSLNPMFVTVKNNPVEWGAFGESGISFSAEKQEIIGAKKCGSLR